MTLHSRLVFTACLLLASSPLPVLPFQGLTSDSPVSIEPRKRPEPHLGITPDMPAAALPPANLRADVSMVLVPAHVTNGLGAPVGDLAKENFKIFEDGVEQPITYFAWEDAPVSVGFLIDSSGSMRNKMHQSAEAASALLKTANTEDEFFVVEFNEKAKLLLPFTSNSEQVHQTVSHVRPIGRTSLLDAVHLALTQMKKARNPRKAIVIVSDGGDNRSRYTFSEVKNQMIESEVQVYTMGIFDPEERRKRTPEEEYGPQLLGDLAQESGGKHYNVDDLDDLPATAERIGQELRSQYILGYSPGNVERDGKYHRIKVMLSGSKARNLDVRYRRGYNAPGYNAPGR